MKKKEIKINFKYFWEGFDPNNNFFTNLLKKKYRVVIDKNPDVLFYSVYPAVKHDKTLAKKGDFIKKISPTLYVWLRKAYPRLKSFTKKEQLPVPQGDFLRIFYASEHIKPNMAECDLAFGSHFEETINHPRYVRLPMYRISDYNLKGMGIPPQKKKISFEKIKREKTKFCNFIYSQDIPFRNDFFLQLSKYKRIDSPGRCMNNMHPISENDARKSRLSKNWTETKINFIKPYKFTIAFENSSDLGWVTEKLTHPMLVNSIPIYFGDKFVGKDFNPKSFVNYHDFNNMEKFIDFIIKVDNDDKLYERILKEPWYNGGKSPKYMDDGYYLKKLVEAIEKDKK